jgi:hypothetical protein
MKKNIIIFIALIFLALLMPSIFALSNESIQAKNLIDQARSDIAEMQSKDIPVTRANESLENALELYNGQLALEEKNNKSANYELAISYASAVSQIKDVAIKANDELKVFRETYNAAQKDANLSSFESDYNAIEMSFREERFEDTLTLIDQGYNKLSELQASQTTIKLFYETTSKTLKQFFVSNWDKLISANFYESVYFYCLVIIVLLIIFWTTLKRLRLRSKIKHLLLQKATLNDLLKKLQLDYFKLKKISDMEYKVKTERFKEMIRDIDRQIPLLKESLAKIDKREVSESKKK